MFIFSNQLINIPGWNVWDTNLESNYITFLLKCLRELTTK